MAQSGTAGSGAIRRLYTEFVLIDRVSGVLLPLNASMDTYEMSAAAATAATLGLASSTAAVAPAMSGATVAASGMAASAATMAARLQYLGSMLTGTQARALQLSASQATASSGMLQLAGSTDTAGQALAVVGDSADGTVIRLRRYAGEADDATRNTDQLRNSLLAIGAAFTATGAAGYLYFSSAAKNYGKFASTYSTYTRAAGADADQLLGSMQAATRGTVAQADLVVAANRAMAMGIERDTLPRLAQIAEAAGRVMGEDTSYMFDSIVTGIARGSPLILDNLGIIVSLSEANEAYATSIGKTAAALTEEEQQTALLYAVMDKGQSLLDMAGTAQNGVSSSAAQATVAIEQMNLAMGQAAAGPMAAWYQLISGVASRVANLPEPLLAIAAGMGMVGTAVSGVAGPLMLQAAAVMFLANQWRDLRKNLLAFPAVSALATGGLSGLTAGLYATAAAAWAAIVPLLPFLAIGAGIAGLAALADISIHGWDRSFVGQLINPSPDTAAAIPQATQTTYNITSAPTQNVTINADGISKEDLDQMIAAHRDRFRRESEADLTRGLLAYTG